MLGRISGPPLHQDADVKTLVAAFQDVILREIHAADPGAERQFDEVGSVALDFEDRVVDVPTVAPAGIGDGEVSAAAGQIGAVAERHRADGGVGLPDDEPDFAVGELDPGLQVLEDHRVVGRGGRP